MRQGHHPYVRRSLLLVALFALGFALLPAAGCSTDGGDGEVEDPSYKPNKAAFRELADRYASSPVEPTDDRGVSTVGHSADITDLPLAGSLALNDAAMLATGYVIDAKIGDTHPAAADFYRAGNSGMVKRALLDIMEERAQAWHETLLGTRNEKPLIDYDFYGQWNISGGQLANVVRQLIDQWRQYTDYPEAQDLTIPVVLADMQRTLSYQERMIQVQQAIQQVVDDLEYPGEVLPVDPANSGQSADQLAERKRELIALIPEHNDIEISFTFEYASPRKIKSITLKDTRGRWEEPIQVLAHPSPVGGRYRYSIPVSSHYIKKGESVITVRIEQADGRAFEQTYDIAGKYQYTDNNVGLIVIKGFRGHLTNLTKKMATEIRLPDQEGRPTVVLNFRDPKVTLTGRPSPSSGGAGLSFNFVIGVYKPSIRSVYYLPAETVPGTGVLTTLDQVKQLPWQICWEENDPDRKYGSLNEIKVPGNKSRRLYVRVDWNGGSDVDVLLFNFEGRDLAEPLRKADTVFTTRTPNAPGE